MDTKHVYDAINAVMACLAKTGITKDRSNAQQGFKFRGIDDVYNTLAPLLADSKLLVLPRVLSRSVTERVTAKGATLFYVVLDVEFDFVSAVDGSAHVVRTAGEAMDSGDKATNKAMSAAYKYACIQAFCIPTEGDNDADSTTHEVVHPEWKPKIAKAIEEVKLALALDVPEEEKARAVAQWSERATMNQEFYVAVWDALKDEPKTRRAIKEYTEQGKSKPQLAANGRVVNG